MVGAAGDGRIKALYVMGRRIITEADTNHAKHAFGKLDFLVVQDIFLTETAAMADVVLPRHAGPKGRNLHKHGKSGTAPAQNRKRPRRGPRGLDCFCGACEEIRA